MFGQEADQLLHQVSGKLRLDVGLVTRYPSRLKGMRRPNLRYSFITVPASIFRAPNSHLMRQTAGNPVQ